MVKKDSYTFVCDNCGASFASWYGKCPECSEWNTLKEFREKGQALKGQASLKAAAAKFVSLARVEKNTASSRIHTGLSEIDRVLGGGLVESEVILVSGEPGVGKSTLILTAMQKMGGGIYISSEEEANQIQTRCERLGIETNHIIFSSHKNIDSLLAGLETQIKGQKVVVFDSLQGLYSGQSDSLPGSISQAKEVLLKIVEFCKSQQIIGLVVGHITKEGEIAGPKFLEHMVDCVLFMEGEKTSDLRILRAFKNRFGETSEVGFFEMTNQGMREVRNPSEFFLDWQEKAIGKASVATKEGRRVVFATVESLVVSSSLAFPKRVAKGVDAKRLELILAILKKYLKLPVDKFDIFVNVSGGLRINDTIADLGVAVSLYSSLTARAFNPKQLWVGELGLLGNVRPTSSLSLISREAKRIGFEKIYSHQIIPSILKLKTISS